MDSYWRFNGASEIVTKSLTEVEDYLAQLADLLPRIARLRADLQQRYPDWDGTPRNCPNEWVSDEAYAWHMAAGQAEDWLRSATRTAVLMATIHLEAIVNWLLYARFGDELTEAIERLTLIAKIEVAHGVLSQGPFRGTAAYAAARSLTNWRNAFAHGKNPDRRTQTLKENHLTHRTISATSRIVVSDMIAQLDRYLTVMDHLAPLSTADDDPMFDEREIRKSLATIRRYTFDEHDAVASKI
ncbi:MAG TPA: hypothetical protein VIL85_22565 [Thermomicrobiales bacterium]